MQYLTEHQLLLIHIAVVDETGGIHGVRDHGAIASAISLPSQAAFGAELYPTVFEKAAVYLRSIIANHPFLDGNKRTAMVAAGTFLSLNGYHISAKEGAVYAFAHRVIEEKLDIPAIAAWLKEHSVN